jgi:hypothetical protein
MRDAAAALLLLAVAGGAAAQQAAVSQEQHVTAPGLPGQANKDVVVKPSGTLKDTGWGIVYQGNAPTPRIVHVTKAVQPETDTGVPAPYVPPRPAGPLGPSVVNAAYVTVRGSVVRYAKGASVTLLDARTGKERTVPLAKGAWVYDGIKAGDPVAVRIPFDEGSDARTADRVEPQKASSPPPPASKFAQAQAHASR